MHMTFRWFGPDDPIPLANIRQIPGVTGIVSALYDVAIGDVWPKSKLEHLGETVERHGMKLSVIESIAVHEDIKLGRPSRDRLLDQYCESVRAMGELGIPVLCYNFMPIFDWTRTDLAEVQPDGSTALSYDDARARADRSLARHRRPPGWSAALRREDAPALLARTRRSTPSGCGRTWRTSSSASCPRPSAPACAWRFTRTIHPGRSSACRGSSPAAPRSSD
jgi:mannonate dehydratase